jgi:hypothetical protein
MSARKSLFGLLGFATVLALEFCAPGGWKDLDSIDSLKAAFNADQGHARLVLLLSPT